MKYAIINKSNVYEDDGGTYYEVHYFDSLKKAAGTAILNGLSNQDIVRVLEDFDVVEKEC